MGETENMARLVCYPASPQLSQSPKSVEIHPDS
jgi:hypothetical protein